MRAADRWAEALAAWRIPDEILAKAPESPWGFPPALFGVKDVPIGVFHRLARAALGDGGSVLDVGCGGGGASVPLVPPATELTGVDNLQNMLDGFARAAGEAGVAHREVLGDWPDVAGLVPVFDVVVCRNVVYNVAPIAPFVTGLTDRAARKVVVELTEAHPSVALGPLWKRFWGLPRPTGPTAAMFAEVLDELGYEVEVERETRPSARAKADPDEYVGFVRRRLCLDPSRDAEIAAALEHIELMDRDETKVVVVAWSP